MAQFSKQVLERLWDDGNFVLSRWTLPGEASPVLALAPTPEQPAGWIVARLEHIYALRNELEGTGAARPIRLLHQGGVRALLFKDPGGNPLARLVGHRWEISQFLHLAIGITVTLRRLHDRGLIHADVNPTNILVDLSSGEAWLAGVSFVSRLRQGKGAGQPENTTTSLAYMAPEQTGRINRPIDARSDLYSLGVTLLRDVDRDAPLYCQRSSGVGACSYCPAANASV
jgi:serine/threonine protein kinase